MELDRKQKEFPPFKNQVIREDSTEPKIVIKMKNDPKSVKEENPYVNGKIDDEEEFKEFFES